jgi:TPP-dependent pyruvate/acetoin dehydrogenase alpha subunit
MIPAIPKESCVEALRTMLVIRRLEEACIVAAHEGKVPGHFHVYTGQEATGVGVISNLEKSDYVYSTHRNHGHLIAKGADPKKVLAEIMTKATGYSGGKGRSRKGRRTKRSISRRCGNCQFYSSVKITRRRSNAFLVARNITPLTYA